MKVGIVGLPNAGKSTLFNALTSAGVETAAYAFTTIDPHKAIVDIPDPRLDRMAEALGADPITHDTITFVDIAGLVPGAHKGEGLGNKFLANIRETDAIVHVVRCFEDGNIAHTQGRIDPLDDISLIETELVMADLEQAERRLDKVTRQAKSGDAELAAERDWLEQVVESLKEGKPASTVPPPKEAPDAQQQLFAITAKPVLYLANVGDEQCGQTVEEAAPDVAEHAKSVGAQAAVLSVKLESDIGELEEGEADEMRAELGAGESGLGRVIAASSSLLQLIHFFTGEKGNEARAWAVIKGSSASTAAGKIHTDIEKGFVRAEVIGAEDLTAAGSWSAAREAGKLRVEGRDYVVQDGDVMTVKFTP